MAGDWIKMRTDLYRDPKVCIIADLLSAEDSDLSRFVSQNEQCNMSVTRNVMRNACVGALVTVWGVCRLRGKRSGDDLTIRGSTINVVDDLADLPGFGSAMAEVGWLRQTQTSIVFPNFFEEYNVDPAVDTAKKNAERQRRYRERLRNAEVTHNNNVTVTSQRYAREEKRRVNIKASTATAQFNLPEWVPSESWAAWIEVRTKLRAPNTPRALTLACKSLEDLKAAGHDPKAVLELATMRGWRGLFAPKGNGATEPEPAHPMLEQLRAEFGPRITWGPGHRYFVDPDSHREWKLNGERRVSV